MKYQTNMLQGDQSYKVSAHSQEWQILWKPIQELSRHFTLNQKRPSAAMLEEKSEDCQNYRIHHECLYTMSYLPILAMVTDFHSDQSDSP